MNDELKQYIHEMDDDDGWDDNMMLFINLKFIKRNK